MPVKVRDTLAQLEDNLGALELELSATQREWLESVSAVELDSPPDLLARRPTITAASRPVKSGTRAVAS